MNYHNHHYYTPATMLGWQNKQIGISGTLSIVMDAQRGYAHMHSSDIAVRHGRRLFVYTGCAI